MKWNIMGSAPPWCGAYWPPMKKLRKNLKNEGHQAGGWPSLFLLVMPVYQYLHYLIQFVSFGFQQNQIVIEQVGSFAHKEGLVVILGLNNDFHSLLPYFLGNFIDPFGK